MLPGIRAQPGHLFHQIPPLLLGRPIQEAARRLYTQSRTAQCGRRIHTTSVVSCGPPPLRGLRSLKEGVLEALWVEGGHRNVPPLQRYIQRLQADAADVVQPQMGGQGIQSQPAALQTALGVQEPLQGMAGIEPVASHNLLVLHSVTSVGRGTRPRTARTRRNQTSGRPLPPCHGSSRGGYRRGHPPQRGSLLRSPDM